MPSDAYTTKKKLKSKKLKKQIKQTTFLLKKFTMTEPMPFREARAPLESAVQILTKGNKIFPV